MTFALVKLTKIPRFDTVQGIFNFFTNLLNEFQVETFN